jgi:bifunctional lysine-specific demethylase and histidyl-hydroxylase NO66
VIDAGAALARLVGDPEVFLRDRFGRAPAYVPADGRDGLTDLLTLDDVDRLVASTGLRDPGFRLVRDGRTLPKAAVTRSVRLGSKPIDDLVDVRAVLREFAAGASIVLQGLHRSFAPVAGLCRSLEVALTHAVQANAYLTPPVAQGLHLHADPHDVFAIQTYGVKRWVVHPPGDEAPWDLELRPGDVLYLPAGTRHAAQTQDAPSLHLTVGVRTTTWREVLRRLVDDALAGAGTDLDAPLPAGWAEDPRQLREQAVSRLADVAERIAGADVDAGLDRAAGTFWSRRHPDLGGGLRDLLELDRLDDDTPLRRRPGAAFAVHHGAEVVRVDLGGRTLELPSAAADAATWLRDATRFTPRDLDAVADGPSRLVLCRRFVREGVLAIDRDREGA